MPLEMQEAHRNRPPGVGADHREALVQRMRERPAAGGPGGGNDVAVQAAVGTRGSRSRAWLSDERA